jgi:CHASE3 domain sensor protein
MQQIIQLTLTLLEQLLPKLISNQASAQLITQIIGGLIALIPLLIKEYQDAIPFIQNVIAVLKNHNDVTPEQLQTLDILETQIDASFEAAAAAALAEDAAAQPKI